MRRFTAFLITVVTVIAIFAINVIGYAGTDGSRELQTDFTLGLDYKGGYEVLYTVQPNDSTDVVKIRNNAIDTITDQAEAAGIDDFDISSEGENQIRVAFPASSKKSAEAVLGVLESNCELTFRKTDDSSLLDEGVSAYDALLTTTGDKAEIATDDNGNVAIRLNLSQDGKEEFNSWITDGKLSKIEDEESENYGGTEEIVIWFGYTEYDEDKGEEKVDSYEEFKQLNENPTFLNSEQRLIYNKYKNKILSVASISSQLVEDGGIEERNFLLTGSFTRAKANSIIDIINNGGLDYTLERETFARVPASEGTASISTTIIALAVGIIALCALLVFVYRLPGVGAAVALIAQVGLSLLVYRAFNGLFGPEVIVALLVSVIVAVDSFVCLFERAKDEMFKGKTIERAYDEASKKTNSTIIDSVLLSLIVSLIIFAVGSGTIRSIATMLAVSMAICLVLTTLLIKLLSNCIFKSLKFEGKYNLFTKKHKDVPNVKNGETQSFFGYFTKVNFFKNIKKIFKFTGCGLLVAVLCGSVWFAISGSPLNLGNDFAKYTKVTIQTNLTDEDILEVPKYSEYEIEFVDKDNNITEESVSKFIENKTSVSVKDVKIIADKNVDSKSGKEIEFTSIVVNFSKVIDDKKLQPLVDYFVALEAVAEELNGNSTSYISNEYVFSCSYNSTKNVTARDTLLNATLAFGLVILAVFIYMSFRYKFTYAIAISAGLAADALLVLGALLITQLEFSILTATCILGILCYSVNDKVKYFDKVRENLKGSRKKVFTHEEHIDYANKALQQSTLRSLLVGSLGILMFVVIMICSGFNYTLFTIVLSLGIAASIFTTMFVSSRLWIVLEDKFTIFMQNKTHKTKRKVKFEEIEEQVFIGIND